MDIWKDYDRIKVIRKNNYITIFKVTTKKDKSYAVIKQYDKIKYKNFHSYDFQRDKLKILFDSKLIIAEKENDLFYYFIIKYTEVNLTDYINITETPFNYEDIREVLLKLNTNLKFLYENNLNYEFKESNIILPLDTIDHKTVMLIQNRNEIKNLKTKIKKDFFFSIGKIIYFLLFLKPFSEYGWYVEERSDLIQNNILQKMIKKMMKKDELDLEIYLNQPFLKDPYFKDRKIKKFDISCKEHPNKYYFHYCVACQKNICDMCYPEHQGHKDVIPFYKIKLNNWEKLKMDNTLKEIEENINFLNKWKESILEYLKKFEKKETDGDREKDFSEVYENDEKNNFKLYYINQLEIIKEKTSIKNYLKKEKTKLDNLFNYVDFSQNKEEISSIDCIYDISKESIKLKNPIISMEEESDLTNTFINNQPYAGIKSSNELNEGKNEIKFVFSEELDDISNMFSNRIELTSINLFNLQTKEVTDMNNMFSHCISLKSVDFSNLETSQIESVYGLFFKCINLTNINFSNIDTSKFKSMCEMFANCTSLKSIDLSNFNTEKVTDMSEMFYNCSSLETIDLSNFKTNNLESINGMFFGCTSLECIDLSNFNTKKVKSLQQLFSGCSSLNYVDISNFNTENVVYMKQTFYNCSSLRYLNLFNFNIDNVINSEEMFSNCSKLERIDLSHTKTSKLKYVSYMFYNCTSMKYLNLKQFNLRLVTNMKGFFYNFSKDCEIIADEPKIIAQKSKI